MITLILHRVLEPSVVPTHLQSIVITLLSVGSVTLGYYLWNIGIQQGNARLLSILSYQTPILSVTWLYLAGLVPFTYQNFTAAILISIGSFYCMISSEET